LSQRALESFGKVLEILTGDPVQTLHHEFRNKIAKKKNDKEQKGRLKERITDNH
jgi:hypothetical protein